MLKHEFVTAAVRAAFCFWLAGAPELAQAGSFQVSPIRLEFSATSDPLATGAHRLDFANRHLASDSVYLFYAVQPSSKAIRIVQQQRNHNQSTGQIKFTIEAR